MTVISGEEQVPSINPEMPMHERITSKDGIVTAQRQYAPFNGQTKLTYRTVVKLVVLYLTISVLADLTFAALSLSMKWNLTETMTIFFGILTFVGTTSWLVYKFAFSLISNKLDKK